VTLYGANNNIIGGTNAGAGNIISANGQHGVFITNGAGLFTTNAAIGNQIQGNYIGTTASGSGSLGNQFNGVRMLGGSSNLIGGTDASARNVIAANKQNGVSISGSDATANVIQGNFIGTDATGGSALGNTNGVVIYDLANNNLVGGTVAGAGNLISGNFETGVLVFGNGTRSNTIQGNLIGTDVSGHADLGNAETGVRVESSANIIGGALAAARNVISGNAENGIYLYLAPASNNIIQGNFIGTDVTGTTGLANSGAGIGITGARANTIGGATVGTGNLISGNSNMAIYLQNGASGNVFQGNFLGTDVTGTSGLANGAALPVADVAGGIDISASPSNLIGGTAPGAGNIISDNWRDAILIEDAGATGNTIQGNFIGTQADGVSPLGNHWHCIEL